MANVHEIIDELKAPLIDAFAKAQQEQDEVQEETASLAQQVVSNSLFAVVHALEDIRGMNADSKKPNELNKISIAKSHWNHLFGQIARYPLGHLDTAAGTEREKRVAEILKPTISAIKDRYEPDARACGFEIPAGP